MLFAGNFDSNINVPTLSQIHHEKLEIKATSRVGSLANVKHRPGGGEKKIFDDKEYIRQMSDQISCTRSGPGSLNGSIVGSSTQVRFRQTEVFKLCSYKGYFQ